MSSPSKGFECRWKPSRRLLEIYLAAQALALLGLFWLDLPGWLLVGGLLFCVLHAAWVLPRQVLMGAACCFFGLRHDHSGWQLCRRSGDWLPITLLPDSLALPWLVILRFRLAGQWRVQSLCLLADSMEPDLYRQLRVRLKFSRQRWRVAE